MTPIHPVQDTICLLAGARVARSNRPGEPFHMPEKRQRQKQVQKLVQTYTTRVLLGIRTVLTAGFE